MNACDVAIETSPGNGDLSDAVLRFTGDISQAYGDGTVSFHAASMSKDEAVSAAWCMRMVAEMIQEGTLPYFIDPAALLPLEEIEVLAERLDRVAAGHEQAV